MKRLGILVFLAVWLTGCATAYYNTMERFGVHKRDILVDRVEDARDSQKDGQVQFQSALDQFKSVVVVDGGNIEKVYDRLNGEYERSKTAADDIHNHINDVESVGKALFSEWSKELEQYSDANLRRESERTLKATRSKFDQLLAAMKKTETRLEPVLSAMYDQVLYLKHNLNARAIQSLKEEVIKIDKDVEVLLQSMQQAIAEADEFIREMKE